MIRGDLAFTKAKSGTMEHLANVPFRITSHTTGEEHVLVTDENGMANTASSWAPHSLQPPTRHLGKRRHLVWARFARLNSKGQRQIWGALPYDTYEIEELPCKENEGTILAHFTITTAETTLRSILDR